MRVPSVNGFFCLNLEDTGKAIGWIGVITGSIGAVLSIVASIFVSTIKCEDIKNFEVFGELLEMLKSSDCSDLMFLLVPTALFCLISLVLNGSLLRGIKTFDPVKILPSVYLLGFETLSIITSQLGTYTAPEIMFTLIIGGFFIYALLALHSLYVKVRDEYHGRVVLNQYDEIN